jgi:menaquinone-dependent protoporphyrinogen oxidase
MNTAIIFMTRTGSTEKVAGKLKDKIQGNVSLVNLATDKVPDLEPFDNILIGGSVKMGKIQKTVQEFCKQNESVLLTKNLGLFICCMYEGDQAEKQFNDSFSEALRSKAKKLFAGGTFNFEELGFFDKMIVKKVAKVDKTTEKFNEEAIVNFALSFNE